MRIVTDGDTATVRGRQGMLVRGHAGQGVGNPGGGAVEVGREGVGHVGPGGPLGRGHHLDLEVVKVLTRVGGGPVKGFQQVEEGRRDHGPQQRSDPINPMVPRETVGDDVGTESSSRVDPRAGVIDACLATMLALCVAHSDPSPPHRRSIWWVGIGVSSLPGGGLTEHVADEKGNTDTERCKKRGLALHRRQHDDGKHELHGGKHLNEQSSGDGTIASQSDVDRHGSRERG